MAPAQTISKPSTAAAPPTQLNTELQVEGYPSLRRAAELVGVSASTLSRRRDVARVDAGRETRVPAAEVIRLAAFYQKRRLSRVAAELVEYAAASDAAETITHEVDAALARHSRVPVVAAPQEFLAEARRLLPASLVVQIEATLSTPHGGERSTVGWSPPGD
jgi:hypothetical protein